MVPSNCMRLSVKKAAHHCPRRVPRAGNPGSHVAFRGFLPRKTTPRDLHQATVIAKPLNVETRLSGERRMTPNRQSPAHALFAHHRYPAAQQIRHWRHQRPRCSIRPIVWVSPAGASKIRRQSMHVTGGWPTNLERLRETKDLSAPCLSVTTPPHALKGMRRVLSESGYVDGSATCST
jgi:hypothetical protein